MQHILPIVTRLRISTCTDAHACVTAQGDIMARHLVTDGKLEFSKTL